MAFLALVLSLMGFSPNTSWFLDVLGGRQKQRVLVVVQSVEGSGFSCCPTARLNIVMAVARMDYGP